ncbi:Uncharacterised protein [Bordetella ansorpii]|uniref:DUF2946 domain-containing protein n=1 Tax=Bordetella ansorpii TaxID=288768 RepID=A0A157S7G5_9BORD|nr:hypothetical protein [Bordetella ansorpii]SAI66183.1 Uncharacterised protein [Bordetella ansorpii]
MSRRAPALARPPSLVLFGLLLFALTLRALVPAGYMPDVRALREGRLALEFCAAAGGLPRAPRVPWPAPDMHHGMDHADRVRVQMPGMEMPGMHMARGSPASGHGSHDHGSDHSGAAGQECPFGLIAHQALDTPVALGVAPMRAFGRADLPSPADRPAPPMPAVGPPLGQRAPPVLSA